jgi:hypothetical protein
MGLTARLQLAHQSSPHTRRAAGLFFFVIALWLGAFASERAAGQSSAAMATSPASKGYPTIALTSSRGAAAQRFLGGRTLAGNVSAARAMAAARRQHAAMLAGQTAVPLLSGLNAAWQPLGPNQVGSIAYGDITGRVTAIAIDPADGMGNTVYLGTTGGGVWKSTNAAGASASVTFMALTDTLSAFSANADASVVPSLSIGAISVQGGVVLAGTGDPNDALDSYYGSGILRSDDGGLTWTLIQEAMDGTDGNPSFLGLGFAGFAWSSASPGTVVAAVSQSAEGVLVNAPNETNSTMGLYYSTDSGKTWQMSTIVDGGQIIQAPSPTGNNGGNAATSVVWNPIRRSFFAAVRYHGYYQSADGVTWTRLPSQPGVRLTTTACPPLPGTTGSSMCPIFRGVLAVQPTTGDTFALTVDGNNLDQGLWQDACVVSGSNCSSSNVTFANRLDSSALEVGNGSTVVAQADYNLSLAAVTSGPAGSSQDTLLYVGTVDLYRCSLSAGCALRNTTNALNACTAPAQVASAQHAIATLATTSQPLLYLGNDGGLWRSTDGVNEQGAVCSADDSTHFQNLNGGLGSLAEVISFAQHPTDSAMLLVGLGANGTAATSTAFSSTTAWPQLSAAEGGTVAIDQSNPLLWYVSTAAGVSIRQCPDGGACTAANFTGSATIGSDQVAGDDSIIDAPWILDPPLSSNVLIGTCRVWRGPADDGAAWSSSNAISAMLAGPQSGSCVSSNPVLRSLAAGGPVTDAATQNGGFRVLYAGMAGALDGGGLFGGHLYSTASADTASSSTVWTDVAMSPVVNDSSGTGVFNPGRFDLSSLAADSHDATGNTIYATVMGFAGNGINASHLYRSIDGGASWTNVSSNLPNAPANSVVVDPNDANTVYIAMDTGVYVTSEIASCTTANCWSVYGTSLPNAPVVALVAAPLMATGDGRTGELRAATYGRGIWQIPLVTALGSAQAAISLSPTALSFGSQAVATSSAPQTITVTNTGSAPLTVSQVTVTGDFNETDTCTASAIAPQATCSIQVSFLPTVMGGRTGLLTVYGNVAGGQATAALSGDGSAPGAIVLTPVTFTFPATVISATSASQNITISNTSGAAVALQAPSVTGDFRLTANTCGSSLLSNTGCTVSIAFTPTASGTRSGTLTMQDDAGTQIVSFTGIGDLPATDALSPLALTFAAQQLTTSSVAQQVMITNSGDVPLTLIAAQASGDFSAVNACGNSLNPHSSCSISVLFQPRNLGGLTGVLSVSDQYRTQAVTLSGTGIAPPGVSLAPISPFNFPNTGVGLSAAAQTVTLTNNDGFPLQVQSIVLTGDFAMIPGSDTCGISLAANASCTMQVIFAPTGVGPRMGSATITDDAPNSPQTLQFTGTGVDFSLTPDGSTSLTISDGQNAVFPLLLSSSANVPGMVAIACTGVPANATCNVTPANVALGGTTTVSVTVLTGVASASSFRPRSLRPHDLFWLAMLVPLGVVAARRHHLPKLVGGVLLCLLIAGSGCGAGRSIPLEGGSGTGSPPPSNPVTPAGTYTVVASATGAGLTRSISLTLVVQ